MTPNDPRPPYVQVADDLRAAITSGRYAPGERLPSGRDLAREYGVALMTMQRALSALAEEGHVALYKSRGAFVRSAEPGDSAETRPTLAGLAREVSDLRATVQALEGRLDQLEGRAEAEQVAGQSDATMTEHAKAFQRQAIDAQADYELTQFVAEAERAKSDRPGA